MIELPLEQMLLAFLTIVVRVTGLMLFAPLFGSMSIAPRIKAGLVVALSILLYPVLSPALGHIEAAAWPALAFGELLIGAAIGVATNLVFDAVQMAGQVLSVQMGFSLVNILDPQTQVDSTVMAVFHQTLAMLIFLRLNIHLMLIHTLARSFGLLPPGLPHITGSLALALVSAAGQVFVLGLQIAAPVFSVTLLTDVILGLIGRASPQAPLMLLGIPVKILLGLSVLFAALKYWPSLLDSFFTASIELSNRLLLFAR